MALTNKFRRPLLFRRVVPLATACLLLVGAHSRLAHGAATLRYQVNQHGDVALFGNTLGYDCRAGVPTPIVGSVDLTMCGTNTSDVEVDVLWRADEPASGQATASAAITPAQARSTAVLKLPSDALTSYARIYWSGVGPKGMISPSAAILVERPGVFAQTVTAQVTGVLNTVAEGTHYQQSADITNLVQTYGPGVYRVSQLAAVSPVDKSDALLYYAWSGVVFYYKLSDPPRSLSLFDSFDFISGGVGGGVSTTLNNFLVPMNAGYDAKLAVVGYQGEATSGDRVEVNGIRISDAQNPDTNFFNATHSYLGQPVSNVGDLPQMSGAADSMNGLDIDTVDITGQVHMGDHAMDIHVSTTNDSVFLGSFTGSVTTFQPVFADSKLDYVNVTNPGGADRPNDVLGFTLTAPNTGSDTSVNTYITVPLPVGLSYVPGSIQIASGAGSGPKTDMPGDDGAEYDPVNRTIKIRIGSGATPVLGGNVTNMEAPVVKFQVKVDPASSGRDILVGGVITGTGLVGGPQGVPPSNWNTGSIFTPKDGPGKDIPIFYPNHPITVPVRECKANSDCPMDKPRCDTTVFQCTDKCMTDNDCKGAGMGERCTSSKVCGCSTDSDCPAHACDSAAHSCVIPKVDLSVTVDTLPKPPQVMQPVVHVITVTNNGTDPAPAGTTVVYTVPPGGTITKIDPGPGWTCMQMDRKITCTDSNTIPPFISAPQIKITVTPDPNAKTVDVNVGVNHPGVKDPNPANNNVTRSDGLTGGTQPPPAGDTYDQLAGGGFSCSIGSPGHGQKMAEGAALLGMLAMLALGLRRRRDGAGR